MPPPLSPIRIQAYDYPLPEDRIARYPLPERDASRLLVWRAGAIRHTVFRELPELLEGDEIFFFNNTRVIPARLHFRKESGAVIETFLLSPRQPALVEAAMQANGVVEWECAVGNLRRWRTGQRLRTRLSVGGQPVTLSADLLHRAEKRVRFEWDATEIPFEQIVAAVGKIPIPPYFKREAEASDADAYQTVYGSRAGAVAAPTAGLHFTPAVLDRLRQKGIRREELTLHVSAGTFRPVETEDALAHDMHHEQVMLQRSNLEALLSARKVIATGTTSMRTLESVYWFGVRLGTDPDSPFAVSPFEPYHHDLSVLPDRRTAVGRVLAYMDRHRTDVLHGVTGIYIVPGYTFRICHGLVTNFHQPCSTLLLLVSAFTGGEAWRDIYREALDTGYRFLSYGDASLLLR
ncbi:MAG: hypothetical protein RLY31_208 [Bacteroidota bacterium]|jgi:S-adenosylmethionine:tRNA ribosyltransferase-isomerase